MTKPSKGEKRWTCLIAFIAGEAYSIYATFFAHALRSPDIHLIDRYSHHRLLPGQIGEIEVGVNWDDLIRILVLSLVIFTLTWCIARLAVRWGHGLTKLIVTRYEENRGLATGMTLRQSLLRARTFSDISASRTSVIELSSSAQTKGI